MREHCTFGNAGGAAGVLQEGDVVVPDPDGREFSFGAAIQRIKQGQGAGDFPGRNHLLDVLDDEIDQPAFRHRQQIADLRADDVLDRRVGQDLLKRPGKILEDDDRLGARILQLDFQFPRRVQRIDIHHRQSGAQDAEQDDRILQEVGQHDRDPLTLDHAGQCLQVRGEVARQSFKLVEADRMSEVVKGRLLAKLANGVFKQFGDRRKRRFANFGRNAGWIVAEPDFVAHTHARVGNRL